MNTHSHNLSPRPVSTEIRAQLEALVTRDGERAASTALCVSRPTLARCLCGLPVAYSVRFVIEERLKHVGVAP